MTQTQNIMHNKSRKDKKEKIDKIKKTLVNYVAFEANSYSPDDLGEKINEIIDKLNNL